MRDTTKNNSFSQFLRKMQEVDKTVISRASEDSTGNIYKDRLRVVRQMKKSAEDDLSVLYALEVFYREKCDSEEKG